MRAGVGALVDECDLGESEGECEGEFKGEGENRCGSERKGEGEGEEGGPPCVRGGWTSKAHAAPTAAAATATAAATNANTAGGAAD